jgi:hypothetical protein
MLAWINYLLGSCFILAAVLVTVDYLRHRSRQRLAVCLIALAIIALVLYFTTGFPFPATKQAFGGPGPLLAITLMFGGVVLGIVATYIFNLSGPVSWLDFARPLVASPIILLPLIGSVQGAELAPVQLVSFTILAFQNGFFWQQVLKDAKSTSTH